MKKGPHRAVYAVVMLAGGKRIASADEGESISIWRQEERRMLGEPLQGHSNSVRSIDASPDSRYLASDSWDDTVEQWDLGSGTEVGKPIKAHDGAVKSMWRTGQGVDEVLILGTDDGMIRRWNAGKGEVIKEPRHAQCIANPSTVWLS
ncbi:hypothetical protein PAXINDRAFT_92785 [Paxillus involutus ATCC 200175]|uniref:Uncharacterized protein n=1 Tax=Paxillus involutus ATCC 200175 TaxID=664439 RepID=A0A0C9TF56_PAXIN|nr:hypothetical protein PAXINDRAFT_92785 [Paxillus involutus ATCC 200175]